MGAETWIEADRIRQLLESAGFVLLPSGPFSNRSMSFQRRGPEAWWLGAYASWGDPRDERGRVDFTLNTRTDLGLHPVGTVHRVLSEEALRSSLAGIVEKLELLAANETLLRCPLCETRWVHLKEPYPGDRWAPFLSCDGMQMLGKGRAKALGCRGTSNRIEALVYHR